MNTNYETDLIEQMNIDAINDALINDLAIMDIIANDVNNNYEINSNDVNNNYEINNNNYEINNNNYEINNNYVRNDGGITQDEIDAMDFEAAELDSQLNMYAEQCEMLRNKNFELEQTIIKCNNRNKNMSEEMKNMKKQLQKM